MIKTMWVNRFLSTWTWRSFVSFFQLVERKFLLTPCYFYNLDLHWAPPCSSYYNKWLPDQDRALYSLSKHHCSSKMLAAICHKTSPSSSSEKPIYPHRVPICDFMSVRYHSLPCRLFEDRRLWKTDDNDDGKLLESELMTVSLKTFS